MTVDEIIKHCDDYITSMNKYADTGNIGWWLEFYHTVLNGFRELKALEAQPMDERDCKTCTHSNNGECAYSEECHECMWESKYKQQPKTIQEKQTESKKYEKAFDDGYENGYAQARFDYEQQPSEDTLEKIRAEIEEYKSRQLTLAIGVDDLEKGKQIALEYVLAILDKYKAASEKGMSDNFEAQPSDKGETDGK